MVAFDITFLPEEIWLKIFSKLHYKDYCQLRLTCKYFTSLSTTKSIRKHFYLQLINEDAVQELKTHLEKYGAGTLPISTLRLKKILDSENLAYILKILSSKIQRIELVDSPVFQNINDAGLNNLEELYMHFDWMPANALELNMPWHIKNCQELSTLHFILRPSFEELNRKILQQLVEAGETLHLKKIALTYISSDDELILKALQIHARKIEYLNIFYKSELPESSHLKWCDLLSRMEQLQTLTLSGNCTTDWVQNIFRYIPEKAPLSRIGFEFTKFDHDEILKFIISKWTKTITGLSLVACRLLTNVGLDEIWKLHKNLTCIEIAYGRDMNMSEIVNGVARKVNYTLRKLSCSCLGEMLDESVYKMAKNLPNLEELELADLRTQLSNQGLSYVFKYLKRLRRLCITTFSCNNLKGISKLQNLEELNLKYSHITSEVADDLIFPNLRILKLHECKRLNTKSFIKIAQNCPALEILGLQECIGLDDDALYYICKNLKYLRKLNIKHCEKLTPEAVEFAVYESGIKSVEYKYNDHQSPDFDEICFIR